MSTGKPNMSISTYVPTFLSDRNWPEMIWRGEGRRGIFEKGDEEREREKGRESLTDLYREGVGYYAVHGALGERVEVFVRPPHELRFESEAAFPVVLVHAQVQLHGQV